MEDVAGIAAASLGQIVEGYAVVFGAKNKINLRTLEMKERRNFLNFVQKARKCVERHFGPTVMFEHGACSAGTNVSCGVDRMHVHLVPCNGHTLIEEIEKKYNCCAITATIEQMLEKLNDWENDRPYFWIDDGAQVFLFAYGEKRESQVVRRAIAKQFGKGECWNWREYPTQEAAEDVAKILLADSERLHPLDQLQAALA